MIHVHVIFLVDMVKIMHVVCLISLYFGVRYPSDSLLCHRLELYLGNAEVSTKTLNDLFKMLSYLLGRRVLSILLVCNVASFGWLTSGELYRRMRIMQGRSD